MGLLDNYTGIGPAPRPTLEHQLILGDIAIGLYKNYKELKFAHESVVDIHNLDSPAPDIIGYNKELKPVIVVDVTTNQETNPIRGLMVSLMRDYPTIKEAFVYNYESGEWFAIGDNVDTSNPSFSQLAGVDMDKFIRPHPK